MGSNLAHNLMLPADQITIRREGTRVLLLKNGVLIADMPYDAALQVSRAMRVKAKDAEEHVKAEQIINDSALLLRTGFPIGLSSNPDIIRESIKEAVNNRTLRRALPGGVKSQSVVGRPSIIQRAPGRNGKD